MLHNIHSRPSLNDQVFNFFPWSLTPPSLTLSRWAKPIERVERSEHKIASRVFSLFLLSAKCFSNKQKLKSELTIAVQHVGLIKTSKLRKLHPVMVCLVNGGGSASRETINSEADKPARGFNFAAIRKLEMRRSWRWEVCNQEVNDEKLFSLFSSLTSPSSAAYNK